MATVTKHAPKPKVPVRKSSAASPAQQVLRLARDTLATGATWLEIHNALFGIGGLAARLFSTSATRTAFSQTPEYADIMALVEAAPDGEGLKRPEANGKLLIRIPKSLHSALIVEAEAEGTSVNQLVVAKLSAQLRALL